VNNLVPWRRATQFSTLQRDDFGIDSINLITREKEGTVLSFLDSRNQGLDWCCLASKEKAKSCMFWIYLEKIVVGVWSESDGVVLLFPILNSSSWDLGVFPPLEWMTLIQNKVQWKCKVKLKRVPYWTKSRTPLYNSWEVVGTQNQFSTKVRWYSWEIFHPTSPVFPWFLTIRFKGFLSHTWDCCLQLAAQEILWILLIERVQQRSAGWKGKLLSLGGRITRINAVLSSSPYIFSPFPSCKMGENGDWFY